MLKGDSWSGRGREARGVPHPPLGPAAPAAALQAGLPRQVPGPRAHPAGVHAGERDTCDLRRTLVALGFRFEWSSGVRGVHGVVVVGRCAQ